MTCRFPHLVLALVLLLGPAAGQAQDQKEKPDPNRVAGAETLARLEAVDSWRSLFNGSDLSGWRGDTEGYVVEDGVLVCQKGAKKLETEEAFSDFVFRFEFKLTESGNNGLGIRVPPGGHAAAEGMELQILDHRGDRYHVETKDGKRISRLKPWQVHGSIYGVHPAKTGYLELLDQWNEQVVICIENHVKVVLNGAVILDVDLNDLTPVDGRDHPGLKRRSGHLQLAGHNDHIEFRSLEIADFSPSPTSPKTEADNTPPEGFAALFDGESLDGWKGLAHKDANKRRALSGKDLEEAQAGANERMRAHWSAVDGVLTYDGKGDSLCTAKDYGDFEMYVDWKIPPGADSGIYLRGTPQIQIWDPWDPRTEGDSLPESAEAWVAAYKNGRNLGSGGLWNNRRASNRPLKLADRKPGEWNTFLVRMVGDEVTIWLNDTLVVDRTELENYWDREGDRTAPLPRADQIELQHHGSPLYFRNLYIRELPW